MKTRVFVFLCVLIVMIISCSCTAKAPAESNSEDEHEHIESRSPAAAKEVLVTVVHSDGSRAVFPLTTDEEYLRFVLTEAGIAVGIESTNGLLLETVDGETAEYEYGQRWKVSKSGAEITSPLDNIPVHSGDKFTIEFTKEK